MEEVLGLALVVWLGIELVFYFIVATDWKRAMDVQTATPEMRMDPEELIMNVLDDLQSLPDYGVEDFLAGWFLGAPLEDVKRGNAAEFLAWAMYNVEVASLSTPQRAAVERMLGELKRRFGATFVPGYNPDVRCSRFTLMPASPSLLHRPLAFYVGITVCKVIFHTLLFQAGFIPYRCGAISYWFRPSARPRGALEPLPLVFFHGISPGLFAYAPMLRNLCCGRAALLVEMPHVGMGLSLLPPSREATINGVRRALKRHGVEKACIVGHSYGTFPAAWMVHEAPEVVGQLVLLDPMCLLLALPDITYNFLYRKPTTFSEKMTQVTAASEMGINNTLRRHFWWFNSVLFAKELKNIPTVVHLAGEDSIAPSKFVRQYLQAHFSLNETVLLPGETTASSEAAAADKDPARPSSGPTSSATVELIWSEGYSHGQVVCSPSRQREIFKCMFVQECRILAEEKATEKGAVAAPPPPQKMLRSRVRSSSAPVIDTAQRSRWMSSEEPDSPPIVRLC